MTLFSKPSVRSSWGQTAAPSDTQDPGDTYTSKGWQIGGKPPRQYFNWVLNYIFAGIRYLCQVGVATWDTNETYPLGALTVNTQDGLLYRTLANNVQGQRPDQSLFSSWDIPYVATAQAGDRTVRIANTGWVGSYFMPVNSPFNFLSGQILNAQVGGGAVTQWQGALTIGGGQVSSAVDRANHIYNGQGSYANFNYVGNGGQPSWLWGTNDSVNYQVWNPSNFSVANSVLLNGAPLSVNATGSSVVQRDASGFVYGGYFNQSSGNNENPPLSQFFTSNGTDGFLRKSNVASVVSGLQAASGWLTAANFAFSSGGYQKINNQGIVQGGRVTISGATNVIFPIAFPHQCFGVAIVVEGSTNQIILSSPPNTASFQATNGNAVINWVAFGW